MSYWDVDRVTDANLHPEMVAFLEANGIGAKRTFEVEDTVLDGPALRYGQYVHDAAGLVMLTEDRREIIRTYGVIIRRTDLPPWWHSDTP